MILAMATILSPQYDNSKDSSTPLKINALHVGGRTFPHAPNPCSCNAVASLVTPKFALPGQNISQVAAPFAPPFSPPLPS